MINATDKIIPIIVTIVLFLFNFKFFKVNLLSKFIKSIAYAGGFIFDTLHKGMSNDISWQPFGLEDSNGATKVFLRPQDKGRNPARYQILKRQKESDYRLC